MSLNAQKDFSSAQHITSIVLILCSIFDEIEILGAVFCKWEAAWWRTMASVSFFPLKEIPLNQRCPPLFIYDLLFYYYFLFGGVAPRRTSMWTNRNVSEIEIISTTLTKLHRQSDCSFSLFLVFMWLSGVDLILTEHPGYEDISQALWGMLDRDQTISAD